MDESRSGLHLHEWQAAAISQVMQSCGKLFAQQFIPADALRAPLNSGVSHLIGTH